MQPWIIGGASLALGLMLGLVLGGGATAPEPASDDSSRASSPTRRSDEANGPSGDDEEHRVRRFGNEARQRRLEAARRHDRADEERESEAKAGTPTTGSEPSGDEPGTSASEVERLQSELAALREERLELMGQPVPTPPEVPPHLQGPAISSAVSQAIADEKVKGGVEATDCTEHPCIIFGRLAGDEEDMEELERAKSMRAYDEDVLTLLFWASSVEAESKAKPKSKPAETGLFALAFYTSKERAEQGEALDRRIRARVMEYWNHDRPAAATDPDADPDAEAPR